MARKSAKKTYTSSNAVWTVPGAVEFAVTLGISKAALARQAGTSVNTLNKIEAGIGVKKEKAHNLLNFLREAASSKKVPLPTNFDVIEVSQ